MIRIESLEGREHFVVPMVMIVEGVLNGSQGPLLYPADELEKSISLWNGKPVIIYHPDLYGDGLAGSPTVFNQQKVGTVFNTTFKNGRLKAEAWLDVERLEKVDKRVLSAVENQEMMEVSTGVFISCENKQGNFNSVNYDGIARNYRPDHLAILPDLVGASSIADGAGLCRNLRGCINPLPLAKVVLC